MNRSRVITNMVWPPKWAWDPINQVVVPALPPPPPVPPPQPSLAMRQAEAALENASETDLSRRRRSTMRPTTYYDATSTVDGDGRVLTPSEILRLESERSASHLSLASLNGMPNVPNTGGPGGTPSQSRQPSSTAPSTIESTESSGLHTPIDTKIKKRGSRFFSFFGGGRSRSESNLAALASDPFGAKGPQLAPPSTVKLGRSRTPSTPLASRTPAPPSPGASSLRVPASGSLTPLTPGIDKRASWVPATSSPLAKSRFAPPAMPTPTPVMPPIQTPRSRTTSIKSTATTRRAPPSGVPRQDQFGVITPTRSVTEPARPRSTLYTVDQGRSPRDSVLFSSDPARARESLVFTSEPGRPRESVVYTFVDPLQGDENYGLPREAQATDLNFETPSSANDPPPAPIPMSREAAFVRDRYAAANAVAQANRAQHVSGPPPYQQETGGDVFGQPNGSTASRQSRSRQSVAPQTIPSVHQGRIRMSAGPQSLDGTPSPSPTQPLYSARRTPTGRPLHSKASSLSAASTRSETEWSFLMHNEFMPQNTSEPPSPTSTARLAYEESSQGHGHRRSNTATGSDFTIPPVPPLPSSYAWQAPPPPVPPIPELESNEPTPSATPTPLEIPNSLPVTPDSPSSPGSPLQLPNQLAHPRKPRPILHIDIPVKTTAAPIILPSVPSAGSTKTVTAVQKPYTEGDVDRTAVEHPADVNAGYADVLLYSRMSD